MRIEIVLIDSEQITIASLSDAFSGLNGFEFVKVDRLLYHNPPPGLDALFLTIPFAERYGSRPIAGRAQILKTNPEDQKRGMPPYVVSGLVLRPEDPRGPLPETRLLISTAIEAVREFNRSSDSKIGRLGFWVEGLLRGVSPDQLAGIFRGVLQAPPS